MDKENNSIKNDKYKIINIFEKEYSYFKKYYLTTKNYGEIISIDEFKSIENKESLYSIMEGM